MSGKSHRALERVLVIVIGLLACSCRHGSRNEDTTEHRAGIALTREAANRDPHSIAAWLGYGMALATYRGDQQPPDAFAREVYARSAAAKVWTELKQKQKVKPNPDLDALATVELSGFMREYVWHYLRRPDWNQPEEMRMSEFLEWKQEHLQSHTPVIDPGVRPMNSK